MDLTRLSKATEPQDAACYRLAEVLGWFLEKYLTILLALWEEASPDAEDRTWKTLLPKIHSHGYQ